jgi:SulP family sulfate permease
VALIEEIKGALNGAASSFAVATATGTLVFASLGREGIALGIVASLIAAVAGGAVASLVSRAPVSISAPRAAVSIVIAGLAASLHRLLPDAPPASIVALTCFAVFCAGILQLAGGALRLGRLVRFVPFPVVAGFTHGVALTLILVYVPMFAGMADVPRLGWPHFDAPHWAAPLLGAVVLAAAFGFARAGAKWPALFLALATGIAAHWVMKVAAPGLDVGPVFQPAELPGAVIPMATAPGMMERLREPGTWRVILSFTVAIASVASIDSLMGALSIETRLDLRSQPDRDLVAQGAGNIASALVGGLAVSYTVVSVQAAYAAGARGRVSGPLSALLVALLGIASVAWLDSLSLVVLAALMIFVATRLADPWGFALLRLVRARGGFAEPLVRESFFVYALVALSMVALDIISALMVGFVASAALFVRTLNRHLVRGVATGGAIHSRRLYPPAINRLLRERMNAVAVVELEGPLFFGTADRIVEEVDALREDVRYVIVDLRRVQALDATAGAVLTRVGARLHRRGRSLLTCGGPAGLVAVGDELPRTFTDRDRAVEWIEQQFVEEVGRTVPQESLEPRDFGFAMGLTDAENDALVTHLERCELKAGEIVFADGEPSDELYFLLSGRVSIVHGAARPEAFRIVTLLPGNIFGNVAFADSLPRTASAICDEASDLVRLRRSALEALGRDHPELVTRVYIELAADIASRLRATDDMVRERA